MVEFRNEQAKTIKDSMVLTDISPLTSSYNLFEIEEGVDVHLKTVGDYEMRIYQMSDNISTDYLNDGVLIMIDKMRLLKENEAVRKEFTQENSEAIY